MNLAPRRAQSWHPERDLKLAQLASWLLHALLSARRTPGPRRRFYVFRNIDIEQLTTLVQQIQHFEMGFPLDLPDPVPTRAEVAKDAAVIVQDVAEWVIDRARDVAAARGSAPAGVDPDSDPPA